jgi:hypothetical protein
MLSGMNQKGNPWVKLEIYVPSTHLLAVQQALDDAEAGKIGNYDHCFAVSEVLGSFRPLPGSDAFIGELGKVTRVAENKIEVNCPADGLQAVLKAIRAVHPYEEPVINIIPLL